MARILFFMMLSASFSLGAMQESASRPSSLDEALQQQDYDCAFEFLSKIPNPELRVDWLKKAANQGHVMCMFGLCKELYDLYIEQNRLTKKRKQKVFAWFARGVVRLVQDCYIYGFNGRSDKEFEFINQFVQEKPIIDCEDVLRMCSDKQGDVALKYDAVQWVKKLKNCPAPTWMEPYIKKNMKSASCAPEQEWADLRRKALEDFLSKQGAIKK